MRRRRFLAAWGTVAATVTGSVSEIEHRIRTRVYGAISADEVELQIAETNAPVDGGEQLDVTLEVENTGETAVRPEIEAYLEGERTLTIETTVDAGETETLEDFSFRAPPVVSDDTVTIRFETAGDAVEETVDVLATETLDSEQTSPDSEITVQPETTVHFEVDADLLGAYGGRTRWFVDGEFAGQSFGPWNSAYYSHRGVDHWQTTFESPGTREVAAAVIGTDETRRATWTVEVTDDGPDAPVIEETDPADESIEFVRGESTELTLEVAYPDGELERVVWWLGHADVILGESDVSGTEDVATLELDRACYGCPIVTWVFGTDGTTASESPWVIDEVVDEPEPELELTILETNDPVDAGALLEVTAELENRGTTDVTQEVELIVGHDPEQVDAESVSVDGDASETVDLEFETATVRRTQAFPARVETEDASDEVTVEVIGEDEFGIGVEILETNAPVQTGERLEVAAELENPHDTALSREVQLVVGHDPDVVETTLVTLEPGEREFLPMEYETAVVEQPQQFPVRVESEVDADEVSVFVYVDDPPVLVSILETNDPIAAGDVLEVAAEVENPTDSTTTDRIELVVGHDPELVDDAAVELEGGESETVDLEFETATVPRTQEFPVYVESDGDRDSRTVRVIGTEDEEVTIGFSDCTQAEAVGEFEADDELTVETLFVDSAGVGNAHYGLTFGDDVDAPFSGTVRFEVGDEFRIDDGAEAVVVELPAAGFGATIGTVFYNWLEDDEIRAGNPHDCVDERRPERPSIDLEDVSPGEDTHEVTFASENPNDLELQGGAFVEGTTDDNPPPIEPGTQTFTVAWSPESDDERLVWEVDLGQYLYDETLRAETDLASEYDPTPTATLTVDDQAGDGETLLVDEATATVAFHLEAEYDDETTTSEEFEAESTIETYGFELDPPLEDDATVEVRVRDAETDEELAAETIEYTLDLEAPTVEVAALDAPDAIDAGETLEVTAELENVGEETATQEIALDVGAQEAVDTESIELAGGEAESISLSHGTDPDDTGEVTITVRSEDDEATAQVTLEQPLEEASFAVTNVDAPAEAVVGDEVDVDATLENEGEAAGEATVSLEIDGQQAVDPQSLSLDGGESASVAFVYETTDDDVGDRTITVGTEDDTASVTLTVLEAAPDDTLEEPADDPPEEESPEPDPPDEEPPDEDPPEPPDEDPNGEPPEPEPPDEDPPEPESPGEDSPEPPEPDPSPEGSSSTAEPENEE